MKPALFAAVAVLAACAKKPAPVVVAPPATHAPAAPDEPMTEFHDGPPSDPILFDLNSDAIVSPYFVERLGAWVAQHRQAVVLTGHACPLGEFDHNHNLAERRAVAVKTYLMAKFDLPGELLRVESKGETEPVTLDPALYPLNRRVEVALEKP